MPARRTEESVANQIQQLLERRQEHADAIHEIDETLGHIASLLGSPVANGRTARRGRPPKSTTAGSAAGAPRGRRRRRRMATTAEESIRSFVQDHGNPTTAEIKQHWAKEGRAGTADNTLSKMVKEKKLKRSPLQGERGSRYALP